jgi:hypothetical protein
MVSIQYKLFSFLLLGVAKYATTPNDFRQLAECYPPILVNQA